MTICAGAQTGCAAAHWVIRLFHCLCHLFFSPTTSTFTSTSIPLIIFGSGHQESSHRSFYGHELISIGFQHVQLSPCSSKASKLAPKLAFCHHLTQVSSSTEIPSMHASIDLQKYLQSSCKIANNTVRENYRKRSRIYILEAN